MADDGTFTPVQNIGPITAKSPAGIIKQTILTTAQAVSAGKSTSEIEATIDQGLVGLEEALATAFGGPVAGAVATAVAPGLTNNLIAALVQGIENIHIRIGLPSFITHIFAPAVGVPAAEAHQVLTDMTTGK